jgi:Tol biopolymer transport system component
MYGEQQIGPEQLIWHGEDELIYSKNIRDESSFTYSKGECTPDLMNTFPYLLCIVDVHKGIYAIFATNTTTGETRTLVDADPGGASRPELSRDGRTLAFVRRVRDKEALVVMFVLALALGTALLT